MHEMISLCLNLPDKVYGNQDLSINFLYAYVRVMCICVCVWLLLLFCHRFSLIDELEL